MVKKTALVPVQVVAVTRTTNLDALSAEFIAAQDVKPGTRETYRRALLPFLSWLRDHVTRPPLREDVLAYKAFLMEERKLRPDSVTSYLVVVRKFFTWLESTGRYPNIARDVKGAKRARGFRRDALTAPQVVELLARVDRSTLEGKRDFALLNLLVRTGLRTVEIIRADAGDIRQESGEALLWVWGKGRDEKDEFVLLTDSTLRPLADYLAARGPVADGSPLFSSCGIRNREGRLTTRTIRRVVKKHLRGMGLDSRRLSAHSFRHTAVTFALKAGASLQEAQAFARHADPKTTTVYAHNLERVANAPERKIDALLGAAL